MSKIKKIFNFEPFFIFLKYFRIATISDFIFGYLLPIIILLCYHFNNTKSLNIETIFTIEAIIIGICSSVLFMLLTSKNEKFQNLNINNTNISLKNALIYRFATILFINIIFLPIIVLIESFSIESKINTSIFLFLLINFSFEILISLTNSIFLFQKY